MSRIGNEDNFVWTLIHFRQTPDQYTCYIESVIKPESQHDVLEFAWCSLNFHMHKASKPMTATVQNYFRVTTNFVVCDCSNIESMIEALDVELEAVLIGQTTQKLALRYVVYTREGNSLIMSLLVSDRRHFESPLILDRDSVENAIRITTDCHAQPDCGTFYLSQCDQKYTWTIGL